MLPVPVPSADKEPEEEQVEEDGGVDEDMQRDGGSFHQAEASPRPPAWHKDYARRVGVERTEMLLGHIVVLGFIMTGSYSFLG